MADLRISSRRRVERLTNAETVRLGRTLIPASASSHVSYPNDTETAAVVVHDIRGDLSAKARRRVEEILGDVDANETGEHS